VKRQVDELQRRHQREHDDAVDDPCCDRGGKVLERAGKNRCAMKRQKTFRGFVFIFVVVVAPDIDKESREQQKSSDGVIGANWSLDGIGVERSRKREANSAPLKLRRVNCDERESARRNAGWCNESALLRSVIRRPSRSSLRTTHHEDDEGQRQEDDEQVEMGGIYEKILLEYVEATAEWGEEWVEDFSIGHDDWGAFCGVRETFATFSFHSHLLLNWFFNFFSSLRSSFDFFHLSRMCSGCSWHFLERVGTPAWEIVCF
jgi:hypothetical protein